MLIENLTRKIECLTFHIGEPIKYANLKIKDELIHLNRKNTMIHNQKCKTQSLRSDLLPSSVRDKYPLREAQAPASGGTLEESTA